ncbi:hypothetical protein [Pseudomonas sp. TWP3-1]|uniref:hypothetical protein n=1 Tax=Pseudomonas sp. TWP3-1 TaxID=2804631 RepID=UPI003CE89442
MKLFVGALALVALAGCSTPTMPEMRQSEPAKTYSSNKPEDALAKCILFAWQDSSLSGGGMPMGMQPGRDGGKSVYAGNREYFADVISAKQGTSIKYYEIANSWVSKILKSEIEACL